MSKASHKKVQLTYRMEAVKIVGGRAWLEADLSGELAQASLVYHWYARLVQQRFLSDMVTKLVVLVLAFRVARVKQYRQAERLQIGQVPGTEPVVEISSAIKLLIRT